MTPTHPTADVQPHGLLERHLVREIPEALESAKVVNIVGPRQSGKTTLVRDLFREGAFVTLDDENVLAAIEADPQGQLKLLARDADGRPVIIDEAQRSRKLPLAIKKLVDERPQSGQFVLTGSSNIFAGAHVADSLAGRVRTLKLLPLSSSEIKRAAPATLLDWAQLGADPAALPAAVASSRETCLDLIVRGGYPVIRTLSDRPRARRYRDYVDAIVDRDVAYVMPIRKTDAMRRLIEQTAARSGQELRIKDLCDSLSLRRETVENYLDVLHRLSLATRLGAWTSGAARREVKHPKLHMLDAGLAAALRNLTAADFAPGAHPEVLGGLLESWAHAELIKNLSYQQNNWRLYHWRGEHGREIDLIAETHRTLVCFEIKASTTIESSDFKHLRYFLSDGPGKTWDVVGIVVYLGEQVLTFGDRLIALPLSIFWSFRRDAE
jgi:predicted AAA+ superfamily ATPase